MRVRVQGRHAYRWPMLRAVVREQVQVQVQFWLVLGFCFCSPKAARGRGVAHAGVLGKGYRSGLGSGWPSKMVWFAAKCAGPAAIGPVGEGGLHRSRFRFRMFGLLYDVVFLLFWLALGFCFCSAQAATRIPVCWCWRGGSGAGPKAAGGR